MGSKYFTGLYYISWFCPIFYIILYLLSLNCSATFCTSSILIYFWLIICILYRFYKFRWVFSSFNFWTIVTTKSYFITNLYFFGDPNNTNILTINKTLTAFIKMVLIRIVVDPKWLIGMVANGIVHFQFWPQWPNSIPTFCNTKAEGKTQKEYVLWSF